MLFSVVIFVFILKTVSGQGNVTNRDRLCRTERGLLLPYDIFKRDACARCYKYMPTSAFNNKFRYDSIRAALIDPIDNTSHVADTVDEQTSRPLLDSFRVSTLADKWRRCCQAAIRCCDMMIAMPPKEDKAMLYCPRTWDGWQCWYDTPAGSTSKRTCEDHIYFESEPPQCTRQASKKCMDNGTWFVSQLTRREWTDYSKCGRRDEHRRHLYFHIATYAISIIAITPALIIFNKYKQLQVPRISMHRHLLASLLLNGLAIVIFKAAIMARELEKRSPRQSSILEDNGSLCKLLLVFTKYFRSTNYAWMFCEAYYLHRLIAAAFAERRSLLVFYGIGWCLPLLPIGIYSILRATLEDEKCWAFPVEHYEWIVNVPNLLSLLANLFFLCDIIRVLMTKLRATHHPNEPGQYRKAVRATIVLVPLFGLHFCLVLYRPSASARCGLLEAYVYLNYALDGLQGLFVSLTFCYFNGEVLYLLKRSYQRYMLQLQIRGSSSAFLRRLSATQDSTINDISQNFHHPNRTKYIENKLKEINNKLHADADGEHMHNNHHFRI